MIERLQPTKSTAWTLILLLGFVALGAAAGVGFLVGKARPRAPEPGATPSTTPSLTASSPPPTEHRVVYRYPNECECPEPSPAVELEAGYELCAQQLVACEERGNFRREPWPDDSPLESPERWTELMTAALRECEVDVPLRIVECSEYPCVAVLDSGTSTLASAADRDAIEATRREVTAKLRGCPSLRAALGHEQLDELVHVLHYDVGCEIVLGVIMAPASSPLIASLQGEDLDRQLRWYFRRGEDIASAWACEPATAK